MESVGEKSEWKLNSHINYKLKSEAAIALFLARLHLLHSITDELQSKKLFFNESRPLQKKYDKASGKPHRAIANQHRVLSAKELRTNVAS